jgi:dihydrofolate reductase
VRAESSVRTADDGCARRQKTRDVLPRHPTALIDWRAVEKIVYSRALQTVSSARTRIEREFDRDAVRRLKQSSGADITVGGAELAGHAIGAGLVDECHLFLCPIVVGGGKRALPDNVRAQLELLDERRFRNGVVHLHYRASV